MHLSIVKQPLVVELQRKVAHLQLFVDHFICFTLMEQNNFAASNKTT